MKNTYRKIKAVNKQISEFEVELENIKSWQEGTCRKSEKDRQIENNIHFIVELKATKYNLLKKLREEVVTEMNDLKEQILKPRKHYDIAASNQSA